MKNSHSDMIRLFDAFYVDGVIPEDNAEASTLDVMALAMDYKCALAPELIHKIEALTPKQRATVLKALNGALADVYSTLPTSPLYRAFPNHEIVPFTARLVVWIARWMGADITFDPALYGADPVTGFQNPLHGVDPEKDAEFTQPFSETGGNSRRKIRILRAADKAFIEGKVIAMMSNLTPFSGVEKRFVVSMIGPNGVPASALTNVKFREKLVELFGMMTDEDYAAACTSVTDALRLAVHLSGARQSSSKGRFGIIRSQTIAPDLTLKSKPRFNLKTSQAKRVLSIVEAILARGTTDHETDFLRYEEFWKRLSEHVRINQFEKRFPLTHKALTDLRLGWMTSWESKYANGTVFDRIKLASKRPGVFVRRAAAICREINSMEVSRFGPGARDEASGKFVAAAEEAFPKVDVMKLLQLYVYALRTSNMEDRFHILPNGKMMTSTRTPESLALVAHVVSKHLRDRLDGTLPWSKEEVDAVSGIFVPTANRTVSEAAQRTARGDRTFLSYEGDDTIRVFLHWKHRSDVDLSVTFYDADLNRKADCSYMSTNGAFYKHSGDILDGSSGAAEYVDIDIAGAKARGIRYALMTANVYTGVPFKDFECYVGLMIRDGRTGRHFEVSTIENKLSLDSDKTRNSPAIVDLETGEMIYVDMANNWGYGTNVRSNAADLKQTLDFYLNFGAYRPTFADVLTFAGTDGGEVAGADDIRGDIDGVLATLADA
ncbi:hypothetical protein RPALISO_9 [Ruegeria phage RpAliso]|nr:hypothetical protein RPALISO_9 [Ruegeria phage RpAliso]